MLQGKMFIKNEDSMFILLVIILVNVIYSSTGKGQRNIVVVNTWHFKEAATKAWQAMQNGSTATDAIVQGCNVCEETYHLCDWSVGFGGSPDENGETALDAMIMDGPTHDVGAVANLRRIKSAIKVAKAVMDHTKETLLVGDLATNFAAEMGFNITNLSTSDSLLLWKNWKLKNCQPNFWQNVSPDPTSHCGPYKPTSLVNKKSLLNKDGTYYNTRFNAYVDKDHHDTIGMVALDKFGNMAAGTSTNGATFKIPGRVGDSPIMGAGAYVDNEVGGAAATGDGDVMMRFLPSFEVVRLMEAGMNPTLASKKVLQKISKFYPKFSGALIALHKSGTVGAACHGFTQFQYSLGSKSTGGVKIIPVNCTANSHKPL